LFPSSSHQISLVSINNPSISFCSQKVPKQFPSNSSCSHQIPFVPIKSPSKPFCSHGYGG
jgi:hypothetical protein